MSNKVHQIIKAGLQHGKYYRVYVTQVNTRGIESPRSASGIIRVGDIEAPPVPVLSLDTSEYANGCYAEGSTVNIMLKWTDSICDDLANYIGYRWRTLDSYVGDGEYSSSITSTAEAQAILTDTTISGTSSGNPPGKYVYFGIQAVDLSHNYSSVYVIKVLSEDITGVPVPATAPTVEPYGIWCLKVSTDNPVYSNISEVIFFRDGWKELPAVKFYKGLTAEYYDALDVLDGISHFYTYLYVTDDGRRSSMSPPSATITAKLIDTSYIDKVALDELKSAWQSDVLDTIAEVKSAALEQAQKVQELAAQLKDVTNNYNELYNKYTITANELSLLSAKVESDEGILSAYGTSIEQNAKDITLRATKGDIDTATGQLQTALVSMIDVQADRITQIVTDTSGYASQFVELSNAIQAKVSYGDLSSQITLAIQDGISVAYIKASRIVLDGSMVLTGNGRIYGKLYASDISLVDTNNQIIWGSGYNLNPVVTELNPDWIINWEDDIRGWMVHKIWTTYYTPSPHVAFNGTCSVKVTAKVTVAVAIPCNSADSVGLDNGCELYMMFSSSNDGDFTVDDWRSWSNNVHPITRAYPRNFSPDGYQQANQYIPTGYRLFHKDYIVNYTASMTIGQQISFDFWVRKCKPDGSQSSTGYVNGNAVNCYIGFLMNPMHIEAV